MIYTQNRFQFVDANNNTYLLRNGSLKNPEEACEIDLDIVERSYNAGALLPGIQREQSKELVFDVDINHNNDADFRAEYNTLLQKAREAVKLQDIINNLETEIRLTGWTFSFDDGGYLRGGLMSLTFNQRIPFWEDIDYTIETVSTGDLIIDNTGSLPVYPVIIVETTAQTINFLIKVIESNFGIGVNDLAFGLAGFNTYVIDCVNGEILLGGILRNQKIIFGTGFFQLLPGENTIQIFSSGPSLDVTIKYKRRFFL